jgi:hypothetical protein
LGDDPLKLGAGAGRPGYDRVMLGSVRMSSAAAIGGAIALLGLGSPSVLAHSGTGTHLGVAGTVQSVDGSSATGTCGSASGTVFTVQPWKTSSPTWTVLVGSGTTFYEDGNGATSYSQLCTGDWAAAIGTTSGTTVSATKVWFSQPRVSGRVLSVNGDSSGASGSFTVDSDKGASSTVDVSGTTKFTEGKASSASFANVCTDTGVSAGGTESGTTLSASSVMIREMGWHSTTMSRAPGTWRGTARPLWNKTRGSAAAQSQSSAGRTWPGGSSGASADSLVTSSGAGWGHAQGSRGPVGGSGRRGR